MKLLVTKRAAPPPRDHVRPREVGELKEKLSRLSGGGHEQDGGQGDSLCDEATLAEQGVQDRERIELVVLGGGTDADASAGSAAAPIEPSGRRRRRRRCRRRRQRRRLHLLRPDRRGAPRGAQRLDALEKRVRSEKVHQEHFTRVLEQLDALDLDGLGDDERAAVRRERKALVLRCERLSAKV